MVVPGDQELGTDDVTKFWLQEDGDITYVVSKCDRDAASVEDIPARLAKRKNCRVVACTVRHIGRGCFSRCAGFAVASLTQACHFPTFYFVSMYARTCQAAGAQVDGEHVDDEDAVNELLGCDDEGTKYIRGTRALLRTLAGRFTEHAQKTAPDTVPLLEGFHVQLTKEAAKIPEKPANNDVILYKEQEKLRAAVHSADRRDTVTLNKISAHL